MTGYYSYPRTHIVWLRVKNSERGKRLIQTIRYIITIIVGLLASYGLITGNIELFQPLYLFCLSLMMLLWGMEEIQKKRKKYAWIFFALSLSSMLVFIQGLVLS